MDRLEMEKVVMKGGRMVRPGERQPKLSTTVPCFAYKRKRVDSNDDGGSTASRKTLTLWYLCGCYVSIPVLILSTITAIIMFSTDLFDREILKIVTLKESNVVYDFWKTPEVHNIVSMYAFNYTNYMDVLESGEKPRVEELGPYAFREIANRVNIERHDNGTLTFQEHRKYEFIPELSNGNLSDEIIIPNMILITILSKINTVDAFSKFQLQGFLFSTQMEPFLRVTIDEFAWGLKLKSTVGDFLMGVSSAFGVEVPDKIGILAEREGLSPDRVTLGIGLPDLGTVGIVSHYNGEDSIGLWESDCDRLDSSTGTFFPGHTLRRDSTLHIYIKSFCRRVPLIYQKDVVVNEVLPAYRFIYAPNAFLSAEDNPENKCFCQGPSCPPSGAFLAESCSKGTPLAISYPHFLYGSPSLVDSVDGIHPVVEKHGGYMDIHSGVGIALAGDSRFQINMVVRQSKHTRSYYKSLTNNTVLPLAWLNFQIGELTPKSFAVLYDVTYTPKYLKFALSWGSLLIILVSGSILIFLTKKRFSS